MSKRITEMRIHLVALLLSATLASVADTMVAPAEVLFPLDEVYLTGGPLQKQQGLNTQYLHQIEPDRLLSWFRKEA